MTFLLGMAALSVADSAQAQTGQTLVSNLDTSSSSFARVSSSEYAQQFRNGSEAKIGSPRYDRLPSLQRIAEPGWQTGQVVSLAAPAAPVRIADEWTLCPPRDLDLGIVAAPASPRETHA